MYDPIQRMSETVKFSARGAIPTFGPDNRKFLTTTASITGQISENNLFMIPNHRYQVLVKSDGHDGFLEELFLTKGIMGKLSKTIDEFGYKSLCLMNVSNEIESLQIEKID